MKNRNVPSILSALSNCERTAFAIKRSEAAPKGPTTTIYTLLVLLITFFSLILYELHAIRRSLFR